MALPTAVHEPIVPYNFERDPSVFWEVSQIGSGRAPDRRAGQLPRKSREICPQTRSQIIEGCSGVWHRDGIFPLRNERQLRIGRTIFFASLPGPARRRRVNRDDP